MGETRFGFGMGAPGHPFSILKRIVMGETTMRGVEMPKAKLRFQYPQADRDG